ncbi:MAG: hypothetical protein K9L19_14315 [Desulfarculaceae bacterium]|nr:hypothetical protein [Desulfarculaceae bacterium]
MRALICLVLLLCLAAAPALAAPPVACGLITQSEAAQALGISLDPGKPTGLNPMGQTLCFFHAAGPGMHYVQLTLTLPPPKLRKNLPASRLFASAQDNTSGAKPISGLGDQAFWGGSGKKMGAGLHVLKADYYFIVDVSVGDAAKDLQAAVKLAKLVLGRLG